MFKMKQVKIITICGMLIAIAAVLGFIKIPLSPVVEIRFSAVPLAAAGALLGPVPAALIGALADIVGFIAKPTGMYFPGFTISSAVGGLIYGIFLEKGKITIPKIVISSAIYMIVVGLILNTINLYFFLGKDLLIAGLPARVIKELVMLPVNILMIAAISRVLEYIRKGLDR